MAHDDEQTHVLEAHKFAYPTPVAARSHSPLMVVSRYHHLLGSQYAKVEASYCCSTQRALSSELASASYPVQLLIFASALFMLFQTVPSVDVGIHPHLMIWQISWVTEGSTSLTTYLIYNVCNFSVYTIWGYKLGRRWQSRHIEKSNMNIIPV